MTGWHRGTRAVPGGRSSIDGGSARAGPGREISGLGAAGGAVQGSIDSDRPEPGVGVASCRSHGQCTVAAAITNPADASSRGQQQGPALTPAGSPGVNNESSADHPQ